MPKKPPDPAVAHALKEYMRSIAAKGGKRGGKSRWKGVSAEDRSAHMKRVRAAAPTKKKAR